MKIKGLGAEQIAAMTLLAQAKKSSEKKDSPEFSIMMEAVLQSAASKQDSENTLDKDITEDLNVLKPAKPDTVISSESAGKSDSERIDMAVKSASSKYGVDEKLIKSIIKAESNFNPSVTSSSGAQGVMQIMPANFKMLGITDGYNIEQNINGGTKILRNYLDRFDGDTKMALMAYNGGPGTMERRGVKSESDLYKMPKETQNYVPKVFKFYSEL
ncbi:lytic transglycosylase domain-containing protein [uncultured Clostridium sp.]|uniref:lytic transglycosylase domain-containing protein n=1 Tax=uncultured Clostridium sp. TaxID=59620 RepID=UPI00261F7F01|nr:lytic transglycosylase domain-containing protein [uncultured Clostridium sp.]